MVSLAQTSDLDAIAALNIEAYREFADHMSLDGWRGMEASLRAVEARAESVRFLVLRDQGAIVGSVGYCPAGKGDPEIFPVDWAGVLLLAVNPTRRGRGIARELVSACIQYARDRRPPACHGPDSETDISMSISSRWLLPISTILSKATRSWTGTSERAQWSHSCS
jgi:predicted N-acetyltransferase YhbS